jgi:glycosyltransferase involved in cell wall biosynthesis
MRCVSVVIPTFRRPEPLLEAIRSALDQPESLEVLVVDDSPEGSAAELAGAMDDARVRYLKNPEPSGGKPAVPRNLGAKNITGRYAHFLDDDDRIAPGAFAALAGELDRNPEVGVAFGVVQPFGEGDAVAHETRYFADAARRARRAAKSKSRLWLVSTLLHQPTLLVNSACLIRREHIEALGGYRPHVAPLEDVDFYLRAIRRFGGAFVDQVILEYRVGHSSLMHGPELGERCATAHNHILTAYRESRGELEYRALQVFARVIYRLS